MVACNKDGDGRNRKMAQVKRWLWENTTSESIVRNILKCLVLILVSAEAIDSYQRRYDCFVEGDGRWRTADSLEPSTGFFVVSLHLRQLLIHNTGRRAILLKHFKLINFDGIEIFDRWEVAWKCISHWITDLNFRSELKNDKREDERKLFWRIHRPF